MTTKNKQPRIMPTDVGIKFNAPIYDDCSIAGKIRDQTDADIIRPEANPKKRLLTFLLMGFRKNSTTAEPKVVIKNINVTPIAVIVISFTLFSLAIALPLILL